MVRKNVKDGKSIVLSQSNDPDLKDPNIVCTLTLSRSRVHQRSGEYPVGRKIYVPEAMVQMYSEPLHQLGIKAIDEAAVGYVTGPGHTWQHRRNPYELKVKGGIFVQMGKDVQELVDQFKIQHEGDHLVEIASTLRSMRLYAVPASEPTTPEVQTSVDVTHKIKIPALHKQTSVQEYVTTANKSTGISLVDQVNDDFANLNRVDSAVKIVKEPSDSSKDPHMFFPARGLRFI